MYLEQVIKELSFVKNKQQVYIPGLWISDPSKIPLHTDYATFLSDSIEKIINYKNRSRNQKREDWSRKAVVYNIFTRFFTAYDHNQDGIIGQKGNDITVNNEGIRETGTFLKTLALLPYLKKIGINTIHLLPITKIGIEGRKGDLGSPYAIKNPFEIDPLLSDPIINMSTDLQFKALIEGAHNLDLRVVQEFIFRTTAIDSDWVGKNPNWFYWIKENCNYGPPKFSEQELGQILKVPKRKGKFIPPKKSYREMYTIPMQKRPPKNSKIASAFADWPPDDLQPPWTDVTYLRLFNYDFKKANNYNYIAYNTIRYYDPELKKKEHINHELWERIAEIIPYYQKTFGIDGAMIDMGHALPDELKTKIIENARIIDPHFAFWDENFDNKIETKKEGYNAVIGNNWHKITKRNGFRKIISSAFDKKPLPQFGTAETHNSPRFGFNNKHKKEAAWLLFNILPTAIPFMHNGFELKEKLPVNTGLNFTKEQIQELSKQSLPLFYKNALNWNSTSNIISFAKKLAEIKNQHPWIFDGKYSSVLNTDNKKVFGFKIIHAKSKVIALFNTNFYKAEEYSFDNQENHNYYELIQDKPIAFRRNNKLSRGSFLLAISINKK